MEKQFGVKPKKIFGQHFLFEEKIVEQVAEAVILPTNCNAILEIGPGMGVLTKYFIHRSDIDFSAIEIDREAYEFLVQNFPASKHKFIHADFLKFDLKSINDSQLAIIGNFPYNISSQILFQVLEKRAQIPLLVGMFQHEVAKRVTSGPGSKDYGILSVLLQPWYDVEYLFKVGPENFNPPPKVQSAVIRIKRNDRIVLDVEESKFKLVVKTGFNQRRKTLRNALKSLLPANHNSIPYLDLRAERLSWQQFVEITQLIFPES